MNAAHLITTTRAAVATRSTHERTVHTLTPTTNHDPAIRALTYESENVTARYDDGTRVSTDLTHTDFAEALDALSEDMSGPLRLPRPAHTKLALQPPAP